MKKSTIRVRSSAVMLTVVGLSLLALAQSSKTHPAAESHAKRHATSHAASHHASAHRETGHHTTSRRTAAHSAHSRHASSRAEEQRRRHGRHTRRRRQPKATAESRRLTRAFVASARLRPMAQQLVLARSVAAYHGVLAYAASHPGEPAAAAYLALGHAYALDRRYADAVAAFRDANQRGHSLDDYADYLEAQAAIHGNDFAAAVPLLTGFAERHPGSLFVPNAPVLLAQAYLGMNQPANALQVLEPLANTPAGSHADFRTTLARAYQVSGNTARAAALYRGLYTGDPLSPDAANARVQLSQMNVPLTAAERKQHADALFNAHQYTEAADDYRALKKDSTLTQADRDALEIYAAVCDLRLKKLSRGDVKHLPVTNDDSAALKLYLQSELARNEGKTDEHDAIVAELTSRYPQSRWLEEALHSGGNMYLIKHDAVKAIADYVALVQHFPHSTYTPTAHWHAAWLNYRLRHYTDAAKLMDEQIETYPADENVPGALYWRGRIYEDAEGDFAQAANFYNALNADYTNTYYAMLARQRLQVMGRRAAAAPAAPAACLSAVHEPDDPDLTDDLPENDPHLIKARLLANAALNEYIRPEIQLGEDSDQWGALAEAEIYESFDEHTRALQAMKRSHIPFLSLPVEDVPVVYWKLVFPLPYWPDLRSDAAANGLDPYLVAALIRQESEFNAGAVSRANAVGLMQLLPLVGKSLARKEGQRHFRVPELLDPAVNLKLGTADLRKTIDRFGGQVEYALAAYNAGDTPVRAWIAENDYKDIPEWVESIPYTETRDYVQAILRNREMYRAIYSKPLPVHESAATKASSTEAGSGKAGGTEAGSGEAGSGK